MNNYDRDIGVVDKYSNDITKVVIIKAINDLYRRNSHILLLIYTQQCLYHHQPGWYTGVVSIPRDSLEQRSCVTNNNNNDDDGNDAWK